jgi:YcxB-like protein
MQIVYELSEKDFLGAYRAHRDRNIFRKWGGRALIALIVTGVAALFFGALVEHSVSGLASFAQLLGILVMWILLLWGLPRWSMRRQFRKQPGAHGSRTVILDGAGAHWRWDGGSSDVEWRNYIRWVEGMNQILFYTSPACFNILPKRALTAEELLELRTLLQQNVQTCK